MEEEMHWLPASIGMTVLACIFGGIALGIYPGWHTLGYFLDQNVKLNLDQNAPAWVQAVGSIGAIFGASWASMRAIKYEFQQKERAQRAEAAILGVPLAISLKNAADALKSVKDKYFDKWDGSFWFLSSQIQYAMTKGDIPGEDYCVKMAHVDREFAQSIAIALESKKHLVDYFYSHGSLKDKIEKNHSYFVIADMYIENVCKADKCLRRFLEREGMPIEQIVNKN